MELELDVKITPNALYDYMLYHTYSGMSGLLSAVLGALLVILFFAGQSPIYLVAGIVVLVYLPYTLFVRSRKQYLSNANFKEPLHFSFNDEGMSVTQGEISESLEWELMYKAVSTPGSIILYTSKVNASIFPKKDLGDKKALLIEMISTHMPPNKVKIRS